MDSGAQNKGRADCGLSGAKKEDVENSETFFHSRKSEKIREKILK